jgi:hypothetical protein
MEFFGKNTTDFLTCIPERCLFHRKTPRSESPLSQCRALPPERKEEK